MSSSRTTTQWRRWGSNPLPFGLESSTLPLSHCAPLRNNVPYNKINITSLEDDSKKNHPLKYDLSTEAQPRLIVTFLGMIFLTITHSRLLYLYTIRSKGITQFKTYIWGSILSILYLQMMFWFSTDAPVWSPLVTTFVCSSHPIYCKQYGPRSDCSLIKQVTFSGKKIVARTNYILPKYKLSAYPIKIRVVLKRIAVKFRLKIKCEAYLIWLIVLMLYIPVNYFSAMPGRFPVFLGWSSTKQQIKCLAQGHNTVTLFFICLVCGFTSQSTAIVMLRWSINPATLLPGQT